MNLLDVNYCLIWCVSVFLLGLHMYIYLSNILQISFLLRIALEMTVFISIHAESSVGTGQEITSVDVVGQNDLLIVGPGVLGRMVAEQWQQVFFK